MGVAVVRFETTTGEPSWGLLQDGRVRPLPGRADDLAYFLSQKAWLRPPMAESFPLENLRLLSPVTAPCQIICQGKNYLEHMLETGVSPKDKDYNILFTKADSCLAPGVGILNRPAGVRLLDYELELGLVIGKEIDAPVEVTQKNLHEYVAAVVIGNDVSARDVQVPQRQWFKGKSYRGFCPVGPVLCVLEPSDLPLLGDLELELKVNGEIKQRSNTRQMMHKPADTLTEISGIFNLRPGDLVLTGTPGGVAMRVKPKSWFEEVMAVSQSDKERFAQFVEDQAASGRYLKSGDVIEATIRSASSAIQLGVQRLEVRDSMMVN